MANKYTEKYDLEYLHPNDLDNSTMEAIIAFLLREIKPGDIFIDVGAFIGCMSVPVAAECNPHLVIAIEPNTLSYPILRRNLAKYAKVPYVVLNAACSSEVGLINFSQKENTGSLIRHYEEPQIKRIDSVTIDDLLKNHDPDLHPVVVKIDAELSESLVWRGMKKSFPNIKSVVMEFFFSGAREQDIDLLGLHDEIVADGFQFYNLTREIKITREEFIRMKESGFNDDFILIRR